MKKNITVSDVSLAYATENPKMKLCEKKRFVSTLAQTGMNRIELPEQSGDAESRITVRTLAAEAGSCAICIQVGRTVPSVDAAWECVSGCESPCLQIKLPVSTAIMEYEFHMKAKKMAELVRQLCSAAAGKGCTVEFIARDATRAQKDDLLMLAAAAREAGAEIITVCDDAGVSMPQEISELVAAVKAETGVAVFFMPSDRLGMASACAVAAVCAGCDGIKTATMGDYFFRPEMLADIIREKGDELGFGASLDCGSICKRLSEVFSSCESPRPATESAGRDSEAVSPDSTPEQLASVAAGLGYELTPEDNRRVYEEFRRVSARKAKIGTRELEAVIAGAAMQVPSTFHLESYVINSGNIISSTAQLTLTRGGERLSGVSVGDGPIDAAFHAAEQIIGHHYELEDFQIQAVTEGREALGSALVKLRSGGRLYSGNGISSDIVGASIRAYINALNKIVYEED